MGGTESKVKFAETAQLWKSQAVPQDQVRKSLQDILQLQVPPAELFAIFGTKDVRELIQAQPDHLAVILWECLRHLEALCQQGDAPASEHGPALIAIRLLTRIVPLLNEPQGMQFLRSMMDRDPSVSAVTAPSSAPQGSAQAVDEAAVSLSTVSVVAGQLPQERETTPAAVASQTSSPKVTPSPAGAVVPTPAAQTPSHRQLAADGETANVQGGQVPVLFARRLCTVVMRLLFLRNFCGYPRDLPADSDVESFCPYVLWANGVGVRRGLQATQNHLEQNRTECLKLLLAMLSDVMYAAPPVSTDSTDLKGDSTPTVETLESPASSGQVPSSSNGAGASPNASGHPPVLSCPQRGMFSDCLTAWKDGERVPNSVNLFFSLVNVVLSFEPGNIVPYSTAILPVQPREELVRVAVKVLAALLDYSLPGNVYRGVLASINGIEDLRFLYEGLVRLLSNPMDSANTYLPNSLSSIDFHVELLFIFWRMISENTTLLVYFCREQDPTKLLLPMLFTAQANLPQRYNFKVVELCMYVLLILSSVRDFGLALNRPYDQKSPINVGLMDGQPTHMDLLILFFFRTMLLGPDWVGTLYDCMMTILSNLSAVTKGLTSVASAKLVQMFQVFSRPNYLHSARHHHVFLFYLLEVLNNLIQYHYEGSIHVVVEILKRRIAFEQSARLPDIPADRIAKLEQIMAEKSSKRSEKSVVRDDLSSNAKFLNHEDEELDEYRGRGEIQNNPSGERTAVGLSIQLTPSGTERLVGPEEEAILAEMASTDQELSDILFERSWKRRLPIQTVLRLLEELVPQMTRFYDEHGVLNEAPLVSHLKSITLVGVLPVPHAIICRRYSSNAATEAWLQSSLWSVIFQKTYSVGIFDHQFIRLFSVAIVGGGASSGGRPAGPSSSPVAGSVSGETAATPTSAQSAVEAAAHASGLQATSGDDGSVRRASSVAGADLEPLHPPSSPNAAGTKLPAHAPGADDESAVPQPTSNVQAPTTSHVQS